ncbi:Uncharacterised protein [Burkholderia oklahomensis]|nr:hypothetical protein BG90_1309 [Burkholderia oklahomensis C6786]SUW59273.1 Uncharacterised protein [Burkholderia oklahomensis]
MIEIEKIQGAAYGITVTVRHVGSLSENRGVTCTHPRRTRTRARTLGAAVTRRRQANARREPGSRRMPNERAKTQRSCGANQGCTGSGTANCDAHRLPDRLDGGNEKGADVLPFRRENCSKIDYCKCPRRMPLLWRCADSMDAARRKSMTIFGITKKNLRAPGAVSFYAMKPCPLLSIVHGRKLGRKPERRVHGVRRAHRRMRRTLTDPAFLFVFYLRGHVRHAYNPPQFVTEGESLVDTSPSSNSPTPVETGNAIAR